MVRIMNGANAFPTRYWRKGTLENFERITVETMLAEHGTVNHTCPPCVFKCVKRNTVFKGRHEGLVVEGPEYETAYVFGGLCEIDDFAEIMWLNDICDRLGVDTMDAGNLCALAIECAERGLIDEKLTWNDPVGVGAFLEKLCLREGIGDLWAEGLLAVAKEYGLEDVAVHAKGMAPAGYEPRKMKGMGLGFATTPRGACHLRATMYKPELLGVTPYGEVEGKAAIYCDWEDRLTIMDTLVYCRFYRDLVQWPYITAVVNAVDRHRLHRRRPAPHRQSHHHDDARLQRGAGHRPGVREAAGLGHREADGGRGSAHVPAERDGLHARRLLPIRGWGELPPLEQ